MMDIERPQMEKTLNILRNFKSVQIEKKLIRPENRDYKNQSEQFIMKDQLKKCPQ